MEDSYIQYYIVLVLFLMTACSCNSCTYNTKFLQWSAVYHSKLLPSWQCTAIKNVELRKEITLMYDECGEIGNYLCEVALVSCRPVSLTWQTYVPTLVPCLCWLLSNYMTLRGEKKSLPLHLVAKWAYHEEDYATFLR